MRKIFFTSLLSLLFLVFANNIVNAQGVATCESKGRACRNTCNSNEEPISPPTGYAAWDCSAGAVCCNRKQTVITPGTGLPGDCFEKLGAFQGLPCPPSNPVECANKNYCCQSQASCDIAVRRVGMGDTILVDCPGGKGINTAIGCIPIDTQEGMLGFILKWAIGVGGGIAFLLILYAGFQIMTSQGDPNRLKAGQELLTAAISGIIMLIFSVFILRVIGVDILGIPGLAK